MSDETVVSPVASLSHCPLSLGKGDKGDKPKGTNGTKWDSKGDSKGDKKMTEQEAQTMTNHTQHPTVWNAELQCCLRGVVVRDETLIELHFPKYNCCDMRGAIKLSTRILPTATRIQTYEGNIPDTLYEKVGKSDWTAYVRRGFHPSRMGVNTEGGQ